jgi:hypothetical protein
MQYWDAAEGLPCCTFNAASMGRLGDSIAVACGKVRPLRKLSVFYAQVGNHPWVTGLPRVVLRTKQMLKDKPKDTKHVKAAHSIMEATCFSSFFLLYSFEM